MFADPLLKLIERVKRVDLIAKATIKHNGKWFNPGDSLKKVKKEDGERLLELNVAEIDELAEKLRKTEEEAKKKAEEVKKQAEKESSDKNETEKK